jgi:dihydropteroate synthase-like protein
VDSLAAEELLRGGRAGADYLLSLTEDSLWIADQVAATPVLIPARAGDLESLFRAVRAMQARGRAFLADAILDPIHFGLTDSIVRYHRLRAEFPDAPIMMGTGNVSELTDADTSGIHAVLLGIASELGVSAVLTTEVSPHARRAVKEIDAGRRMLYAARQANALPRDISAALLTVHGRRPFPDTPEEIAELASAVRDPSFRVQVSASGIHAYNRDGHHLAGDPFELFPALRLEGDGAHAFYMGVELGRAQIAWQLGKRYAQDEPLDWGCAADRPAQDLSSHHAPGSTLRARGGEGGGA